jgi:hypothetical protein
MIVSVEASEEISEAIIASSIADDDSDARRIGL